ncbi:MAG: DUF368 domain-containing protein [Flavobacteriales bacterium]|nr:DUF368 domain-containing protein [Bacteroidota bacterium]MCB9240491.1 DUF368 domain-containing protein [Flavobacteriales bacterium]
MRHLIVFLKGLAMGAADVVPGVSGGTIAFITGIYDQLLNSINAVNLSTLKLLRKEGIAAAWKEINGHFLLPLFAGIAVSFLTLARVFKYLLDSYPHLLWAFFFGLIIGSILIVYKMIKSWNLISLIALILGTVISYWLTVVQPGDSDIALWFVFVSGALAICAMILPGISGSFILLLLGMYYPMLDAFEHTDVVFIGLLALGAMIGLLSFSRFLKWTLSNYYEITISMLLGFLVGSLNKIWPWKQTLQFRTNSHGERVPFIQENVSPTFYQELGLDPQIGMVSFLMVVGLILIVLLSRFNPEKSEA